jgi:hypothetical protein
MNTLPDPYAFSMTLARLALARKGLHPDLLPKPPLEAEYLAQLGDPAPIDLYKEFNHGL